jgi:hypothetical protein
MLLGIIISVNTSRFHGIYLVSVILLHYIKGQPNWEEIYANCTDWIPPESQGSEIAEQVVSQEIRA